MKALVWSAAAQRDLREILRWYRQFDEELPLRLIALVEQAAARLLDHPQLGPELPDSRDRAWLARGTPFVLLYRPTATDIRILQVRHAASDWKPVG